MAFPRKRVGYRHNLALAKRLWSGQINREQQHSLKSLSENYGLSIAAGDLQLLENRWYVTHSGLLRLAQRRGCSGIAVNLMAEICDPASSPHCRNSCCQPSPAKGLWDWALFGRRARRAFRVLGSRQEPRTSGELTLSKWL